MIGKVLQFQDLQELCRPGERPRLATVERWARGCGIRIQYDGKGGSGQRWMLSTSHLGSPPTRQTAKNTIHQICFKSTLRELIWSNFAIAFRHRQLSPQKRT